MKKKHIASVLLSAFLFTSVATPVFADTQVKVTLPTFKVTLNGTTVDNSYSQYPLIVYKDITYFPMTYHGARFLNVKANWYDSTKVLFVGKAEEKEDVLQLEKATSKNKSAYTATIPTYQIAVNTIRGSEFLDNSKEPYPVLNFRGVTYFPLTWRFEVDEFGWEYSFDNTNGLVIRSSEMFRPVLDDSRVGVTSPHRGVGNTYYYYSDDYYVGFPNSTVSDNYKLIICKRGEAEREYSLEGQLATEDFYYFDSQYYVIGLPGNADAEIEPTIEDNMFSIYCCRQSDGQNVLIKIDVTNGKVISEEIVSSAS